MNLPPIPEIAVVLICQRQAPNYSYNVIPGGRYTYLTRGIQWHYPFCDIFTIWMNLRPIPGITDCYDLPTISPNYSYNDSGVYIDLFVALNSMAASIL